MAAAIVAAASKQVSVFFIVVPRDVANSSQPLQQDVVQFV
jgi:hypothetical protein